MRTAGNVLKEAREKQQRTVSQVARQTRIKEKFLEALEDSDWESLPNFTVAHGFARNYALAVGENPSLVTALLRRDFPKDQPKNQVLNISFQKTSLWTPKTTIIAVVLLTVTILGGYLIREYLHFSAPPPLQIERVKNQEQSVLVAGQTIPTATVEINGQSVVVDKDGKFSLELAKKDLINSLVEIEASSRTGKKTFVKKPVPEQP